MKLARHITLFLTGLVSINTWAQTNEIEISSYTYKDTLQLDFYKPFVKSDEPRPLMVLMHGGGFAEGNRNGGGELKFCQAMAEKGYAVASISYRLTRKNDPLIAIATRIKKYFLLLVPVKTCLMQFTL